MGKVTYCGLDFHKNDSQLCFLNEEGKVLDEVRIRTRLLTKYLSNKGPLKIGVEASGGVFNITQQLKNLGHDVRIINPVQFRAIGINGKKTDKKDAMAIATALRLNFIPEVHHKTMYCRRIGSLISSRDLSVRIRTHIVCHIRGILREYGLIIPAGMKAFWDEVEERIEEVEFHGIQTTLNGMVDQVRHLNDQVKRVEQELSKFYQQDENAQKLAEIPGVGELSALAILSALDDVSRFESAKKVGSYFGLVPKENSSGSRRSLGGITKAGQGLARKYLIHGARSVLSRRKKKGSDPILSWAKRIESKQGTNKAAVALAHKNVRICFALLRDDRAFNQSSKKAA